MRNQPKGFTLIELMIAVAAAAILASIAMPSFAEYLTRGRIPEATGRLAVAQLKLEQYFQDRRTYVGAPACSADTTSSGHFDFTCPVQQDVHYVAQAVGKGPMAGFVFSVDDDGVTRTVGVPPGWQLPSRNCWVLRRDGSC